MGLLFPEIYPLWKGQGEASGCPVQFVHFRLGSPSSAADLRYRLRKPESQQG
jgi:hypothetical protein